MSFIQRTLCFFNINFERTAFIVRIPLKSQMNKAWPERKAQSAKTAVNKYLNNLKENTVFNSFIYIIIVFFLFRCSLCVVQRCVRCCASYLCALLSFCCLSYFGGSKIWMPHKGMCMFFYCHSTLTVVEGRAEGTNASECFYIILLTPWYHLLCVRKAGGETRV